MKLHPKYSSVGLVQYLLLALVWLLIAEANCDAAGPMKAAAVSEGDDIDWHLAGPEVEAGSSP